jgi:hypothetical protein
LRNVDGLPLDPSFIESDHVQRTLVSANSPTASYATGTASASQKYNQAHLKFSIKGLCASHVINQPTFFNG